MHKVKKKNMFVAASLFNLVSKIFLLIIKLLLEAMSHTIVFIKNCQVSIDANDYCYKTVDTVNLFYHTLVVFPIFNHFFLAHYDFIKFYL